MTAGEDMARIRIDHAIKSFRRRNIPNMFWWDDYRKTARRAIRWGKEARDYLRGKA